MFLFYFGIMILFSILGFAGFFNNRIRCFLMLESKLYHFYYLCYNLNCIMAYIIRTLYKFKNNFQQLI